MSDISDMLGIINLYSFKITLIFKIIIFINTYVPFLQGNKYLPEMTLDGASYT